MWRNVSCVYPSPYPFVRFATSRQNPRSDQILFALLFGVQVPKTPGKSDVKPRVVAVTVLRHVESRSLIGKLHVLKSFGPDELRLCDTWNLKQLTHLEIRAEGRGQNSSRQSKASLCTGSAERLMSSRILSDVFCHCRRRRCAPRSQCLVWIPTTRSGG